MIYDKISSLMDIEFSDWLLSEMNNRGWTQADLARASGLNRQSVSDYINRRRSNPEPGALVALAQAFKISPISIFRKAGLLPEGGEHASFEDWQFLLNQLPIVSLQLEQRYVPTKSPSLPQFTQNTISLV